MKKNIPLAIVATMLCCHLCAQQQFTQTVSTTNTSCNTHCTIIDAPGFTYDPNALIFATSVTVNSSGSSPNLIGALYRTYERKWSIFSLSGAPMTLGAQYKVEYYAKEDANHFILIVPRRAHANDPVPIDHAGLNNNPSAQIQAFPTNPQTGNAVFNIREIQITYDPSASKWFLSNKAGEDIESGAAYNIMFASGSPTFTNPNTNKDLTGNVLTPVSGNINATNGNVNKDINGRPQTPLTNNGAGDDCHCIIPKSLPPDSTAGGDLGGNYPSPMVTGLLGRSISGMAPKVGDVLVWNGSVWEPSSVNNNVSPSIISFKQSSNLDMNIPNVDNAIISGLDNQTFPVNKICFIVFHASISANIPLNIYEPLGTALVNASFTVEIYNSSNDLVASASNASILGKALQTMVVVGQAILQPGTYHTKVTMSRGPNGSEIMAYGTSSGNPSVLTNSDKGGELFIEVLPWNAH